jgi:hypothetical protein
MKVAIRKSPRGASQDGVPVERYLECLRRILKSLNITHMQSAKFSTHSDRKMISYNVRQKWNQTIIETVDLLKEDENVVF